MTRALVAISSAVALQLASLGAPLLHAHLDDHDHDRHHGVRVHAHFGGHRHAPAAHGHGPAILSDDDSERATSVQLFVAVEPAPAAVPAVPQSAYVLPTPLESIMRRPPAVAHGHDPPGNTLSAPRAPPSFLS